MTRRQQLIDAYRQWLDRYEWDVFGTLTFPGFPSRAKADGRFINFISQIKSEAGTGAFRYVKVAERGAYGDNLHFHILIGGLRAGSHRHTSRWCSMWRRMAGVAVMGKFEPKKPGIRYLLKTLIPEHEFDITMHLPEGKFGKEFE